MKNLGPLREKNFKKSAKYLGEYFFILNQGVQIYIGIGTVKLQA